MVFNEKHATIYTDGACSYNPGPGGWGAIIRVDDIETEISGYERMTTNNRMELTAAIKSLQALDNQYWVSLYTDSSYLVNAFNKGWLTSWQNNNWIRSNLKPVENRDLWEQLVALTDQHCVSFIKVKGHASNEKNNRCDFLATQAILKHGKT